MRLNKCFINEKDLTSEVVTEFIKQKSVSGVAEGDNEAIGFFQIYNPRRKILVRFTWEYNVVTIHCKDDCMVSHIANLYKDWVETECDDGDGSYPYYAELEGHYNPNSPGKIRLYKADK